MHLLYSERDHVLFGTHRIRNMLKEQSIACVVFLVRNSSLESLRSGLFSQGKAYDSEAGAFEHIKAFVHTYAIDCSELLKPNIADYKTFNQYGNTSPFNTQLLAHAFFSNRFFYRELRAGARPVDSPEDPKIISSGADCRLTVFETVDLAKEFWIKVRSSPCLTLRGVNHPDLVRASSRERTSLVILPPFLKIALSANCIIV